MAVTVNLEVDRFDVVLAHSVVASFSIFTKGDFSNPHAFAIKQRWRLLALNVLLWLIKVWGTTVLYHAALFAFPFDLDTENALSGMILSLWLIGNESLFHISARLAFRRIATLLFYLKCWFWRHLRRGTFDFYDRVSVMLIRRLARNLILISLQALVRCFNRWHVKCLELRI